MSLPGGGRRWFVIVNPVAGGGRGLDHFPLISKLLRDAGIQTEPVFTEHKFHATELTVSAVKQGFRRIIAVGGDGTLHEVVNGLFIQQTVDPREVLLAVVAVERGTTGSARSACRIAIRMRSALSRRDIRFYRMSESFLTKRLTTVSTVIWLMWPVWGSMRW